MIRFNKEFIRKNEAWNFQIFKNFQGSSFWRSLLAVDAWLWRYLSWPEVLLKVIACLRCLILLLFVVFQSTWPFYCLPSMLDSDAICRGRSNFWKSLLAFDAWFWRWATYRISVSFLNAAEFRNALEQVIFSQRSASLKLISMLSSQLVWDM